MGCSSSTRGARVHVQASPEAPEALPEKELVIVWALCGAWRELPADGNTAFLADTRISFPLNLRCVFVRLRAVVLVPWRDLPVLRRRITTSCRRWPPLASLVGLEARPSR